MFGKKKTPKQQQKAKEVRVDKKTEEQNGKTLVRKQERSKIKDFLISNWYLVWGAIILNVIFSYMVLQENSDINRKYSEYLQNLDRISKRVIFITPDGRVFEKESQVVNAYTQGFEEAVVRTFEYYLVWDWASLTDNFTKEIKTLDDLIKYNPKVKDFVVNYFDAKKYPQGIKDVEMFFTMLISMLNNNKLPEYIKVTNYTVNNYDVKKNNFEIEVAFKVFINYYDLATEKYKTKEGVIKFIASGEFDPSRGNPINPLGIIFKKLNYQYVIK